MKIKYTVQLKPKKKTLKKEKTNEKIKKRYKISPYEIIK